jgi:hypothetical protein
MTKDNKGRAPNQDATPKTTDIGPIRRIRINCRLAWKVPDRDRDGAAIKRGVYHLTDADRRKLNQWLNRRDRVKVGADRTALLFGEKP